jgi:hypothetical protein
MVIVGGLLLAGGVAATAFLVNDGSDDSGETSRIADEPTAEGESEADPETSASGTSSEDDPELMSVPLGEVLDTGTFRYVVHEVLEVQSSSRYLQPEEGNVLVAVDLEITNLADEGEDLSLFAIEAFDVEGYSYHLALANPRNDLPIGYVLAGQSRRGDLTFEVPAGTVLAYMVIGDSAFDATPLSLDLR